MRYYTGRMTANLLKRKIESAVSLLGHIAFQISLTQHEVNGTTMKECSVWILVKQMLIQLYLHLCGCSLCWSQKGLQSNPWGTIYLFILLIKQKCNIFFGFSFSDLLLFFDYDSKLYFIGFLADAKNVLWINQRRRSDIFFLPFSHFISKTKKTPEHYWQIWLANDLKNISQQSVSQQHHILNIKLTHIIVYCGMIV